MWNSIKPSSGFNVFLVFGFSLLWKFSKIKMLTTVSYVFVISGIWVFGLFAGEAEWWKRDCCEEVITEFKSREKRVHERGQVIGSCAASECGEFGGLLCPRERKATCLWVCCSWKPRQVSFQWVLLQCPLAPSSFIKSSLPYFPCRLCYTLFTKNKNGFEFSNPVWRNFVCPKKL